MNTQEILDILKNTEKSKQISKTILLYDIMSGEFQKYYGMLVWGEINTYSLIFVLPEKWK